MLDSTTGTARDPAFLAQAERAQYVSGHFGWQTFNQIGSDAIRFTVVREPFSRLRSLYLFAKSRTGAEMPVWRKVFAAAKELGFRDFCLVEDSDVRAFVDNAMARTLAYDYFPYQPCDGGGVIAAAKANLEALNLIADASELDQALPCVAALTGTICLSRMGRLNETPPSMTQILSRDAFLSDRALHARIALDLDVYAYAQQLMKGHERVDVRSPKSRPYEDACRLVSDSSA